MLVKRPHLNVPDTRKNQQRSVKVLSTWVNMGTHKYWAQDACSKAYDEPFEPGAVAERGGIQNLEETMGGCHKTNEMTTRKKCFLLMI